MNELAGRRERIVSSGGNLTLPRSRGMATRSLFLKRLFDMAIAGCLLVVLSPVLLITAFAVFITLGRPLMFRQERCGKGKQSFIVNKFRTMTDARNPDGMLLPDEMRQTALTAFIRRIRVDELPQLFAVMRGDMSFVGPRPLPTAVIDQFGPAGELRCSTAPGMTGWAQVNGNTRLTNDEKIALDIWYVDRASLWLDIRIIFMTLRTIFVGEAVDTDTVEAALAHLDRRFPRTRVTATEF